MDHLAYAQQRQLAHLLSQGEVKIDNGREAMGEPNSEPNNSARV